ncbi:hypothetical protein QA601_03390 [Chitinispirillales bacterium ANBcel5]|uniref:hypothetical protein n=1 Tax=Cellulosispirillum alkaliphilum TaxID=3039283 RepID=UPI002A528450|nr:hypothetical protein [Chitinispirillales bacterium ANBcel5]
MSFKNLLRFVLCTSSLILLWLTVVFSGCGGGFGSDSINAPELEEAIFGSDTTR